MKTRTVNVTFTGDFADNHADDLQTWLRNTFVSEFYSVSESAWEITQGGVEIIGKKEQAVA